MNTDGNSAIRAIDPAEVLAKVGVTNTNLAPPRLMAMCGYCRSAGEEYCVQYLTDLRWDGAEWCCEDCFDGSGENGDWDEATQPCPQPAPDAVARLVEADTPRAWTDVLDERKRQITVEDWTPEHDDAHGGAEMAHAAACYTICAAEQWGSQPPVPFAWPWDDAWWKPTTPRRNLVKAAALILAEIERLDRAAIAAMEADHD